MSDNNELIGRKTMVKGSTVVGAGLGVGAAAAAGTVIGGGGVLGAVGSAFGLTVAAATPVGWLIGGAVAGGAALHYGSKLIGAKGKSDGIAQTLEGTLAERHEKRIQKIAAKLDKGGVNSAVGLLSKVADHNADYQTFVDDRIKDLNEGVTAPEEVILLACQILNLDSSEYLDNGSITIVELNAIVSISIVMMLANGEVKSEEENVLCQRLKEFYDIDEQDTSYLIGHTLNTLNSKIKEPANSRVDSEAIILSFAEFIVSNVHLKDKILSSLEAIAKADGDFDKNEKVFFNFAERAFTMSEAIGDYQDRVNDLPETEPNLILKSNGDFDKKVKGAINSYAYSIPKSSVIALYDNRWLANSVQTIASFGDSMLGKIRHGKTVKNISTGGADEGFLFTTLGIISDRREIIFYSEIKNATFLDDYILLDTTKGTIPLSCRAAKKTQLLTYFNSLNI